MVFDFDTPIERRGTDSMKWGRYGADVLPLWVADMDFAAPPPVIAALQRRLDHGVFGYGIETEALNAAVVNYVHRRYGWDIEAEWLVWLPGLVSALNVVCKAVEGGVFTATPVYPPFMSAPKNEKRALTTTALLDTEQGWRWDFEAADRALSVSASKLWLLCHPHNPVGRAWRDEELNEIARLAQKYDLIVCSDEIHCDLILDTRYRHKPFAMLGTDAAERSVTLMAPSKTYNIPGLGAAWAVIPNAALRSRFREAMAGIVPHLNVIGMAATIAALEDCDDWLAALLDYLRGNARLVEDAVAATSGLRMHPVEATYLAWIDAGELCRQRGFADPEAWCTASGVALSSGRDFSAACGDFVRLNFGCRRATLRKALASLLGSTS
ncbi:MAG: PatB family C-S lyase [Rhodocyclaceae bacterium]|nr:PatB family C-S lyase [Rhodocyclaceae bacterium]